MASLERARAALSARRTLAALLALLLALLGSLVARPSRAPGRSPASAYALAAARTSDAPARRAELDPACVLAGEALRAPAALAPSPTGERRAARLACRVTTGDGAALPGVRVRLARGAYACAERTTDADGSASFTGLPADLYTLCVEAETLPPGLLAPERELVVLERGRVHALELLAERAACVQGYVRDPQGAPASGAVVQLRSTDPERRTSFAVALADDSGSYVVEGLRPGSYRARVELTEEHRRTGLAAPWPEVHVVTAGSVHPLDFRLQRAVRTLSGRLVDREGLPLAGAEVWCEALADAAPAVRPDWSRTLARSTSDDAGRFVLDGLPDGEVSLWVAPRALAPAALGRHAPRLGPLRLALDPRGGSADAGETVVVAVN